MAAPVPPSHQAGEETVRRRAKRERNNRAGPGCCDSTVNSHQHRRSKSRSKSRSPGREIDRAIVIVHHHTTCSHSRLDRTASPDNLSESSISFHENEVNFDLSPGSVSRPLPPENILPEPPVLWYERSPGNVKKCDSNSQKYSNWESCRESWFSSGSSEVRPSSGSDCPPCPPVRPTESSAPNTPHCRRSQESSSPSTLPRSAVRPQSSRDSGSSSSRPNSRPNTRPNTRYPLPPPSHFKLHAAQQAEMRPNISCYPTAASRLVSVYAPRLTADNIPNIEIFPKCSRKLDRQVTRLLSLQH